MTYEEIKEMTKGKVGFYWEEDRFPVIEVFLSDISLEGVKSKIETLYNMLSIKFDYESFTDSYHRIIYVFDNNIDKEKLSTIIEEMEEIGSYDYNEDY